MEKDLTNVIAEAEIRTQNLIRDLDVIINETLNGRVLEEQLRVWVYTADEGHPTHARFDTLLGIAERHDCSLTAFRPGAVAVMSKPSDLRYYLRMLGDDMYTRYHRRQVATLTELGVYNSLKSHRDKHKTTPRTDIVMRIATLLGWQFSWRAPHCAWPHYIRIETAKLEPGIKSHRVKQFALARRHRPSMEYEPYRRRYNHA